MRYVLVVVRAGMADGQRFYAQFHDTNYSAFPLNCRRFIVMRVFSFIFVSWHCLKTVVVVVVEPIGTVNER